MPETPEDPTIRQEEEYFDTFAERVQALAEARGRQIREMGRRIRDANKRREKTKAPPFCFISYLASWSPAANEHSVSWIHGPVARFA